MKAKMCSLFAAALGLALLSVAARGGTITMTLDSYLPQNTYAVYAGTSTISTNDPAALQKYSVQAQSGNSTLFPDHIELFCIEIAQNVSQGSQYTFEVLSADQGAKGGPFTPLGANILNTGIGADRAKRLEQLYAHVFVSGYQPSVTLNTDAKKSSFQLAVWELSHDDNLDIATGPSDGFYVPTTGDLAYDAVVNDAQALVAWIAANPNATQMELLVLHNIYNQDLLVPTPESLVNIPEPSTYALLTGLAAIGAVAFRRKFSSSCC